MSNVAVFNPSAVPAHLLSRLNQNANVLPADKLPRISLLGNRFTLIDENGIGTPVETVALQCVILDCAPSVHKVFFASAFVAGVESKPTCSSKNGSSPDEYVLDPIHSECAFCPKNEWGSKGNVKACSDRLLLAVLVDGKVYQMDLAPTALKQFQSYCESIGSLPLYGVKCTLRFDAAKPTLLTFKPIGFVSADDIETNEELAKQSGKFVGK